MSTIKEKLSSIYSQDNPVSVLRLLRELIDAMDETATQADIAEVKASLATLTDDLSAEVTARIAGDEALNETMRTVTGQLKLRCTALENNLTTETAERKKVDDNLTVGLNKLDENLIQLQSDVDALSSKKTISDTATATHPIASVGLVASDEVGVETSVMVREDKDGNGEIRFYASDSLVALLGFDVYIGGESLYAMSGVYIEAYHDPWPNDNHYLYLGNNGSDAYIRSDDKVELTALKLIIDTRDTGAIISTSGDNDEALEITSTGVLFNARRAANNDIFTITQSDIRSYKIIRQPELELTGNVLGTDASTPIGTYAYRGTPTYNLNGQMVSCPGTLTLTFTASPSTSLDATFDMPGIDAIPGQVVSVVGTCHDWDGGTGFVTVASKPGSTQTNMSVTPVGGRTYAFSANLIVN